MGTTRFFLGIGLALAGALGARAGWLELGAVAVRQEGRLVEVFGLRPVLPGAPSGQSVADRLESPTPRRRLTLDEGEALFLVSMKHEDLRPRIRRELRVVVEAGGTLLVGVGPETQAAWKRLQQAHESYQHLRVDPAPASGSVLRRWAPGASEHPPHPQVLAACDAVDRARWSADVATLVAFGSRNSRVPGIWEASEWSRERFLALGLSSEIQTFPLYGQDAPNVVARLFPGAPGEERPIVLIGAHLDSINYGSDQVAPGADDNASGSAAVLEAARVLSTELAEDPGVEFRFALFSGEEQGLYGSKAMARRMAEEGELPRVRAVVILDMIAFDQGGDLDVTLESKAFNQAGMDRMAELAARYTSLVATTTTHAWGSDHMPFLNRGVPAILPIEGEYDDNPHDHTGHDVEEHLNPALAEQILRLSVASMLDAAGIGSGR